MDVGLIEGVCVSVGRGMLVLFGMVGVLWMDGVVVVCEFNVLNMGVIYMFVYFVLLEGLYYGCLCLGVVIY